MIKCLLLFVAGAAVASFSVGFALGGAPEWEALAALVVGGFLMIWPLFIIARG